MSKDDWPKRNKLQSWFLDVFPKYLLLLILIGCIVVAIGALLGSTTGNVFSNLYSSDPFCSISVTAKAWLDQDENGKLDDKELSLPGIQISIRDREEATDSKGEVHTLIWTQCKPMTFTVVGKPPPGYRFTTPNVITVTVAGYGNGRSVYLGLTYLPGAPTITPQPLTPTPHS